MAELPCVKCGRPVQVDTGGLFDPLEALATFNRELARRGDRPIPEAVPCSDCEQLWKAKRSRLQSEYTQRSHEEWRRYKAVAEAEGREAAERQMARWWATDASYQELRRAWHRKHDADVRRKGDEF